jgi:hypothetical protein
MQKQDYQEIGDPVIKDEVNGSEREEEKQGDETDKLVNIDGEDDKDKQMPDFIAAEAKKADIGFYVLQVLASLGAGCFAAYSGYNHSEMDCSHPVAFWLEVTGATIVSIGLLWWVALFALKYIKRTKMRGTANKFFSFLLVCIGIFFVVWWVLGHVWVFQTSKSDCDSNLYLTGLWFIIGVYIYLVLMMCLQCWVAMCLVCCAVFRPFRRDEPTDQPPTTDGPSEQPLVPETNGDQEQSENQENPDKQQS